MLDRLAQVWIIGNFHIMWKSSAKLRQSSDNSQLLIFSLWGALTAHNVTYTVLFLELKFEPLTSQIDMVTVRIIGDCFGYDIAVNARLWGALSGSVPVLGTMIDR